MQIPPYSSRIVGFTLYSTFFLLVLGFRFFFVFGLWKFVLLILFLFSSIEKKGNEIRNEIKRRGLRTTVGASGEELYLVKPYSVQNY